MEPFDIMWSAIHHSPSLVSVPPPRLNPGASSRARRFLFADESKRANEPQLPPNGYYQFVDPCDCYHPRVIAGNWCRQCKRSTIGGWRIAFYPESVLPGWVA